MAHTLNNNGVITTYNTLAEYEAAVALISTTDTALIARLLEAEKAEQIGKRLLKDLYQTLKQQNLTQANEADLMTRINPVLLAIIAGFLNGALSLANGLVTGGALTAPRKTFLVNAITAALAELNA